MVSMSRDDPVGRIISSCSIYLHADVRDQVSSNLGLLFCEREKFIRRQPPTGEKDDYDSEQKFRHGSQGLGERGSREGVCGLFLN